MEERSRELIWLQSKGDLKTLRKYIDSQKSHSYAPRDLDKLLHQAKNQRVMLVADKAGMCKTTVLTRLSKKIQKKFPANWLVRIDLNDYTKLFEAQKGKEMDKGWVLEFVSKEVLQLESHLETELFKKAFEGNGVNKVVVMVDGFDEISPNYKQIVIDMLQVLKQTSLEQLWVTTRPHLREDLEDSLQQLSYTLQPFSDFEQVEFLKQYWIENLNLEDTNQHRSQMYATALNSKLAQSIGDKDREFTGIPLQTRMLAETFEEEFRLFYESEESDPKFENKLDLLGLYSRFIDKKYEIYYEHKSKLPGGNQGADAIRKIHCKILQQQHQQLALEALFTANQVTSLQISLISELSDEDLTRIGIVQRNNEARPQFIHRTFAEYLVAEFLIKELTQKTERHERVQEILLNVVLLQGDCQVIRAFLNGLLENSKLTEEVMREHGEKMDVMCYKKKGHATLTDDKTALHEAAKEANVRIIEFLIDSLKLGGSLSAVTKLLLAKDHMGETAYHKAAKEGHIQVVDKMWDVAKELQLQPHEMRNELLLSKDKSKETAWHKAAERGHVRILDKMWNVAKELQLQPKEMRNELLLSQDKSKKTAWHKAAERGHVEMLDKLRDWGKEIQIKPREVKYKVLLSKGKCGETPWRIAAQRGKVEILEKLWDWAKESQLTTKELRNELLLSKNKYMGMTWHIATENGHVNILEKLWDWAKEMQLKPEELRNELLLSKDKSHRTVWQKAAENGHVKLLEKLWDWAKELQLKPEELRNELLLSKDESKETAWQKAAGRCEVEILEKLWDWAKELQLKPEELRNELLLSKDESKETAWQKAAEKGDVKLLEKLWNSAK